MHPLHVYKVVRCDPRDRFHKMLIIHLRNVFGFLGSALEADRRSGLQCLLNELVDQVGLRIYEN